MRYYTTRFSLTPFDHQKLKRSKWEDFTSDNNSENVVLAHREGDPEATEDVRALSIEDKALSIQSNIA